MFSHGYTLYLIADVSFAVLSESAPEMTSGSSSSDTPITDFSLITSSSEALYSFSSPWTASATLGKGLGGCMCVCLSVTNGYDNS